MDIESLIENLTEDSKFKLMLKEYSGRIEETINQNITYEDIYKAYEYTYKAFKCLVNDIFKESENFSKESPFAHKVELKELYDKYRLFKESLNDKERAENLIKALIELSNNKNFRPEEDSAEEK